MRPTYIELAAFGSYRGKVVLDMTRLGDQGLYLITGDTGAGKSTLFDAIAYALYGIASGDARRDTMVMRNGAAREDEETYVELRFVHNGSEYSVRRNMEYRRHARRGGGTTLEKENAVLRAPDGTVTEGVRRVNAAVQELLGIGSEHFTRILMIAQGDFARLLLSDTKDREPILRAIFGTHIFENFQRELVNRAAAMERELAPLRARIESRFDPAMYPDGHPAHVAVAELAERPSAYRAEELIAALEMGEKLDSEELHDVHARRKTAQTALDAALEQLASQRQLEKDFRELEASRAGLAQLDAQADEMARQREKADAAARAARLDGAARARGNARRQISENKAAISALSGEKERLNELHAQRLLAVAAADEGKSAAEAARRTAESIERQLKTYDDLAELTEKHRRARDQRAAAERDAAVARQKRQQMEDRAAEIDARRAVTAAAPADLARMEAVIKEEKTRMDELRRLMTRMDELAQDKDAYGELLARLRAAREAEQRAAAEYADVRLRFLASQAGLLASELADGTPCPVCGATDHPAPAQVAHDAPAQADMDAAERCAGAAREKTGALAAESGAAKKRLSERFEDIAADHARITGSSVSERPQLDGLRAAANNTAAELREKMAEHEQERSKLAELNREDAVLSKERATITGQLPELAAARDEAAVCLEKCAGEELALNERMAQLRASLEYASRDEAAQAMNAANRAYSDWEARKKAADEALAACLRSIASASDRERLLNDQRAAHEEELAACEHEFSAALYENAFADEAAWQDARMPADRLQSLTAQLDDYARRREFALRTYENLAKKLENASDPDVEAAENRRRELQQTADGLTRADAELAARIDRARTAIAALRKDGERFSEMGKKLENMQQLANVASGRSRSSMGRITFERFILIDYFSRVLVQANLRFSRMAGGQYELVRARESTDMRLQTGLELNVVDHFTGRERSVRSLSGGEAFMASLSLALGFADVIRQSAGGVAVDAMFVDEGFGSLDPEALDQVMNTLTALAGGDKLIGIISHVSDLKARIPRRVIVEKTREGSTARIEA